MDLLALVTTSGRGSQVKTSKVLGNVEANVNVDIEVGMNVCPGCTIHLHNNFLSHISLIPMSPPLTLI